MEHVKKIVESKVPKNIPLCIKAEFNIHVPDAASLQYHKLFVDKVNNKTLT
jgi:hypothetical protein